MGGNVFLRLLFVCLQCIGEDILEVRRGCGSRRILRHSRIEEGLVVCGGEQEGRSGRTA